MSDLILYHALVSTCSQKVRYALGIKRLKFASKLLALPRLEHLSDDYLVINPNGVVPALVHRGTSITDSSVICEYLDEVFNGFTLTPDDPVGRARMRVWMRYLEEVATPAVRPLSFNAVFAGGIARMSAEERTWMLERTPLRRHFYRRLGSNGFAPEIVAEAEERLDDCFGRVEQALAGGGPFLLGPMMTIADITLLPSAVRLLDLGRASIWASRPHTAAWLERMMTDPAWAMAYPEGSRLAAR